MNPRIKQLAKQAGFQYDPVKEIWYLEGLNPSCDQEFEKLSELIIGECVTIADEYDGAGSTIVGRIKKHFGVEE